MKTLGTAVDNVKPRLQALEAKANDLYDRLTKPDNRMQLFWDEIAKGKDEFKKFSVKVTKEINAKVKQMEEEVERVEASNEQNDYQLDKLKKLVDDHLKAYELLKFKVETTQDQKHQ